MPGVMPCLRLIADEKPLRGSKFALRIKDEQRRRRRAEWPMAICPGRSVYVAAAGRLYAVTNGHEGDRCPAGLVSPKRLISDGAPGLAPLREI